VWAKEDLGGENTLFVRKRAKELESIYHTIVVHMSTRFALCSMIQISQILPLSTVSSSYYQPIATIGSHTWQD